MTKLQDIFANKDAIINTSSFSRTITISWETDGEEQLDRAIKFAQKHNLRHYGGSFLQFSHHKPGSYYFTVWLSECKFKRDNESFLKYSDREGVSIMHRG